ncbi:MAG TPA: ThiF family adenylyltransferase [Symbiobacteriaceae bacterium]|nr:ThiF family adenylyltransferase [Symbiobacteriaceae bacterium]
MTGFSLAERARLQNASVLLIGLGGLGSPIALQLAAAGVGRLGLCDPDEVDLSNLQRQVAHGDPDVGRPKIESAAAKLWSIRPELQLDLIKEPLTSSNALDLFRTVDLIVDGSDNFATRYLANDAAFLTGKPLVHGSISRWDGQVSVFATGGPCYRCLHPEPPPPGSVPSCAEAGVIGILPGTIGSVMAMEAIKWLLGRGAPLQGRVLTYNALWQEWGELRLRPRLDCPLCGPNPTLTKLIDYEQFCGGMLG